VKLLKFIDLNQLCNDFNLIV